jgi:hypothetical protein
MPACRRESVAIEDENFSRDGSEMFGEDSHAVQVRCPCAIETCMLFAHDNACHCTTRLRHGGALIKCSVH